MALPTRAELVDRFMGACRERDDAQAEVGRLREQLWALLEMPHHNDERGYCLSEACLHDWSDYGGRKRFPHKRHDVYGGCVLVEFSEGNKEWHDRDCEWVKAHRVLLEPPHA